MLFTAELRALFRVEDRFDAGIEWIPSKTHNRKPTPPHTHTHTADHAQRRAMAAIVGSFE